MNATCIKPFIGARDGELRATQFQPGDLIEGDLARVAVTEGWAVAQKIEAAPETQALGGAPAKFPGPARRRGRNRTEPDA